MIEEVFKRYDIRGYYREEIDETFAFKLGVAFGKYLLSVNLPLKNQIIIGNDLRDSSPSLKNAFIKGVQSQNIMVYDVGIANTDLVAFISKEKECYGVMITASHNAYEMNGFKFMQNSLPFTNEMLNKIKNMFLNIKDMEIKTAEDRIMQFQPYQTPYKEIHYDGYRIYGEKAIKLLSDREILERAFFYTKNSSLTSILGYIKRNLTSNIKYEGNYIIDNSLPSEPTKEDVEKIGKKREEEIVFMFDPDADRVLIYDKEIGTVEGNALIFSLAKSMDVDKLVVSIDFSEILTEELINNNIKVIKTRVGDVFVSNEAFKEKAELFGEPNYHVGFSSMSWYSSGFITSLLYLNNLDKIREIIRSLPKYEFEIMKVKANNGLKKVKELVKKDGDVDVVSEIDGIKFVQDGVYVLVRSSGTEKGLLKIYLEGKSKEKIKKVQKDITEMITQP